jgi:hypothetical protein
MSLNGLSGYLDIPNANLRVAGAGQFSSLNVGSARVFASYDLDVVTAKGNTTPYTIEFSNATTGFVTSSNAQIGGDLTVSSNLTVAGNTMMSSNLELSSNLILNEDLFLVGNTQFNVNSKVVTEFTGPHGRPQATLTKFPEIQMTEAAQAGYVVSASAEDSANDRYAWKAFNNILPANSSTDFWFSGSSRGAYTGGSSGREYVGSSNLGTDSGRTATVDGEWIQVHLPYKIQLTTFNIFGQPNTINNFPVSGVLYARNETTEDWTSIYVYNDVVISTNNTKATHTLTTSTFYNTYALSITKKSNSVGGVSVGELKLFGTPQVETAGNISQDTTLKSIYNTPSNLDANVYLDGDLGATLTNQISGGPTLTGTGATYDSAGKYWSLDGSTESNVVTGDLAFQGDQPHSVSLWFNSSNLEANVANSTIYHIGTAAATGDATHRVRIVNKSLSWNYENDLPLKANTWHHLTHTYGGVGGYRTLYLDGRKVESAYAGDTSGDYPPFGMTGFTQGGYTVTSSGDLNTTYHAWKAFYDGSTGDGADEWVSAYTLDAGGLGTIYDAGSGDTAYTYGTGRNNSIGGVRGEWIKIQYPNKILVSSIDITTDHTFPAESPRRYTVLGSDDNLNWTIIRNVHSGDGNNTSLAASTTPSAGLVMNGLVNASRGYTYIAIVITQLSNYDYYVRIPRIRIYGHKENDLIRFPDATNVRKYPDTAMVSNGPQRGYTVSASDITSDAPAWYAFDGVTTTRWRGSGGQYTNGDANSTVQLSSSSSTPNGSWIKVEFPHKLKINRMRISGVTTQSPKDGELWASNNDSDWTQIFTFSNMANGSAGNFTDFNFTPLSSDYFKYFALIVTKTGATNETLTSIYELELYGTQESTPVLARLGGAFEGKVANFRVYNKCIKEDQALELWDAQKDQFGLAKSSVTVYKGRVGIGTTEPQAALTVADEVVIPKSGEFPPGAMTNYETHFKDHGLFRASSSGEVNTYFRAWKAFSDTWYGDSPYYAWEGNISYTASTGYLTTPATAPITNGIAGAWVQLELPYTILLTSWSFTPERRATLTNVGRDRAPQDGYLFGSVDGVTWSVIENWTDRTSWADGHTSIFNVTTSTYYKYFRLVWTRTVPGGLYGDQVAVGNLSFFGTPETTTKYSTLHDGELTLTKSLHVPRIGPAPDSWFYQVPQRDKLLVEFDTSTHLHIGADGGGVMDATDTSGNDNHGYYSGDFSTTNESWRTGGNVNGRMAFYFDGNNDELTVPNIGNPRGAWVHSVSVWVSPSQFNNRAIFFLGTDNGSDGASCLRFESSTTVRWFFNANDIVYNIPTLTAGLGNWTHFVCVYDGGVGTTSRRVWMNGQELTTYSGIDSTVYTNTLNIPADTAFRIARRGNAGDDYDGFISSIRLYDGILSTGDVQKLYEMGRNGPMQTMNIIGTAVGINQNNPQASLDVAGKIKGNGSVTNFTGQHRCVPEGPMEPGLIVSADKNRYVNMKDGLKTGSKAITIDESLPVVALSNVSQDKSCFGVVSSVEGVGTSRSETKGGFISEVPKVLGDNRAIVNSLGEGALWVVNTGGPLESGDYVTTSNVAGYGQRQDDDVLHNYTVAKITMDCDFTASNVATQAPKKVETLVTVEEGVWSNLSAYNRSSETQTQYINGENVVLTEGEWSNLATEEQNTYSDTTITTYYEIRRGENLLDENGNIQWEDTDGVEPGYKVRFLTSDGTQTDEANAVHTAAFVGCTYHCG